MQVLSLTTIYPNEQADSEGRSVALLDRTLSKMGVGGTTLVLKPWVPHWIGRRVERWKHLAVRRRMEESDGVRVCFSHYLHVPTRFRLEPCVYSMASAAMRLIRKHRLTFDVIHGECIYPAALAARLVACETGIPFIITLRDDLSHLRGLYERRKARRLFEPMFSSVSAIFVLGPAQARDVPQFIPSPARPSVVLAPNGVDLEGVGSILRTLPPPPKRSWGRIVSVGNLFRTKGIHENLQALKILKDQGLAVHYWVVGDGPYRTELENLAERLGLKEQVIFLGQVPHREAIRQIWNADIFCLPSWKEAFGNVYAEAAVCGRPAIGCKGFGAEMTIDDNRTGCLVPPKDVSALANALAFLLQHPEKASEMGRAAQEHIQMFTWERTGRIYQQTLEKIVCAN
jgi:teichuronic acid biosynthesis glycosyltransferase TuaC